MSRSEYITSSDRNRSGKAAIQETLGYYDPDKYPLRNANTNAGLRFLGYDVK
jgi:hypothetical protein